MNLYKIYFTHYSPKDSEDGIKEYLVASNDREVYEYLDSTYNWDLWKDRSKDGNTFPIYEDEYQYKEIGRELYEDHIIRVRGDINSEFSEVDDAYYGVTHFGWELIREDISESEYQVLKDLGVVNG